MNLAGFYLCRPTAQEDQELLYRMIEETIESQTFVKSFSEQLVKRLRRKEKPTKEDKEEISKLLTHINSLIYSIGGLRKNKKEVGELILKTILDTREKNVSVIASKYKC